ncbi:solute carrier family 2, facilitated glucose transporter member 5-like isoform X3 [Hemicordylus capensis]|uniref:solute carrier family 2, facilitated glucose transporter member 5-like isoform X3 n=1 Tax=Hemicordylus capensis TaxID=884348 RepID=UPI002302F605|nr:solute carrier family 2, facilitated glucose transporter member 5-like isoform X3 [Hemicordylus capensis]
MGNFQELTGSFILITVISCLGSLQYGYNFWILYSPTLIEEELDNVTFQNFRWDTNIFYRELTVAIFPVGGLLGSLCFAFLADKCGRKGTMMLNDILSVLCAVLLCWFKVINSFPLSFATRFAAGISTGSPILVGLTGIGSLFQLFLLLFLPESPRYLLIQKKKEREAKQVLKRLRGSHYTEDEIEELHQEDHCEQEEKGMRVHKLLCSRSLRWPLLCSIILTVGQQFSGVNAAYFYIDVIFNSTGIGKKNVEYLTVGATCFLVMTHIIGIYGVDAWGRRIVLLYGFGICSISCILLTMTLELETTISWMPYMSTIFVIIFLIGHIIGPGPVNYVLTTELFLQSSRSSAFAIIGSVQWFCNGLIALVFLYIQKHIGPYSFLIFFPFSFATLFYILKYVPETKRKTFLSIRKLLEMNVVKNLGNEQEANKEVVQEPTKQNEGKRESTEKRKSLPVGGQKKSLPRGGRRKYGSRDGKRKSMQ